MSVQPPVGGFLGPPHAAAGTEPLLEHVATIQEFQRPAEAKGLQSYLGLVNFYRRFIPGAARILLTLTDARSGGRKSKLVWIEDISAAFRSAKLAVC
jgi:hypothetical protein